MTKDVVKGGNIVVDCEQLAGGLFVWMMYGYQWLWSDSGVCGRTTEPLVRGKDGGGIASVGDSWDVPTLAEAVAFSRACEEGKVPGFTNPV